MDRAPLCADCFNLYLINLIEAWIIITKNNRFIALCGHDGMYNNTIPCLPYIKQNIGTNKNKKEKKRQLYIYIFVQRDKKHTERDGHKRSDIEGDVIFVNIVLYI